MPQPIDMCELFVDILYRIIEKASPKKYFTLEVNMMIGAVFRLFFTLALVFALEITDVLSVLFYSFVWILQAIIMKYETIFIFNGTSSTKRRELWYKILSFLQDCLLFLLLLSTDGTQDISKFLKEDEYSFSGLYKTIIICLAAIDVLEIFFVFYVCQDCREEVTDYYSPGQAQYFLKFRLIGGIIGIFIILIFFLVFKDKEENQNSNFIQYLMPIYMGSETIILIPCIYQLCRKRKKERVVVPNKAETEKQLRNKKWYCIIEGFTYGLFEVPVAMWILGFDIIIIIHNKKYPFLCAGQIKTYEIVEQRDIQEEQLNTIIK